MGMDKKELNFKRAPCHILPQKWPLTVAGKRTHLQDNNKKSLKM